MKAFHPKKGMYFVVIETRVRTKIENVIQSTGKTMRSQYDILKPKRLTLYYCDFNEGGLVKGIPITYLNESVSLYDTLHPEFFELSHTVFFNPPPEVIKEANNIISSFENRDPNKRIVKVVFEELKDVTPLEEESDKPKTGFKEFFASFTRK